MLLLYQWTRLACQVRTVVCRVRCWVRSWILFSPRACIALSNTRKANPHEWHFLHTFYFLFLTIYFVFNCVYCGGGGHVHIWTQVPRGQKKATNSPDVELKAALATLCGCWGLDSSPLQEQYILLTTEPSLPIFLSWWADCFTECIIHPNSPHFMHNFGDLVASSLVTRRNNIIH